jgi:microtubule-associated serine/threonine kinase
LNPSHNNDGRNRSTTPPPPPADHKDVDNKESLPRQNPSRPLDLGSGSGNGQAAGPSSLQQQQHRPEPLPRPQLVLNIVTSEADVPMHVHGEGEEVAPYRFNSPIHGPGLKCSEPCLGTHHTVLRNPRLQGILASGECGGGPPPTPTSPLPPPQLPSDKLAVPPDQRKVSGASGGGGMSRSISDTTLRRAALHLNLSQSVLPSFTSLQQFKKELSVSRRATNRNQRKSMIVQNTSPTLPRCHSPNTAVSPLDSPKVSPSQFAFVNMKKGDGRRWSVASLPSSGYGTTPGSSNVSSQCSSQEKLHQLAAGGSALTAHGSSHHHSLPATAHCLAETQSLHRFSSNDSNPSLVEFDDGRRSPAFRPRSRSLSSPIRTPLIDNEIVLMNTLYKERFPKATQQMEERLNNFITDTERLYGPEDEMDIPPDSVAILRFVHHQVTEMARDCLAKSEEKLVTSRYFYEMSESLEKLLVQTRDKSPQAAALLTCLIKKLLLIVSRPARLLECLEFDPEEFYQLLEAAEGQARVVHGVQTEVPQYIISKLGLTRDPLAELQQDLAALDTNSACSSPDRNRESSLEPQHSTPKGSDSEYPSGSGFTGTAASFKNTPSEEDFDVTKLISNGAYGAVYLVKHKDTKLRYALKKINKQNLILRNQVEQVFAERDIMSFTDNPFVVSMYCSFESRKHLCMVMEYVEGGDCANLLKNIGPFPADMARFYFGETVLAVEYLHSFGIVHRDLKPDNLLITALGHIKLTDFGLSKMGLMSLATNLYEDYIDRDTKQFSDKQVFGTPEYIAPEVILRQGYGKPVDWWSMGIILYEFLIGCVPFFGETPEELFGHTVNDDIEWPDAEDFEVQDEAKEIITLLLQQNPLDRLGTSGALEVKEHIFFLGIDWNSLLRMKADFIPQLEDEDDTSYFDSRSDRYNHSTLDSDAEGTRSSAEDSLEDAPLFRSFSSCSPRYRKVHGKDSSQLRHSISRCESSDNSDNLSLSSQSPNSLGSSPSFGANGSAGPSKLSMSPELRRPHQIEALTRAENTKSCPELEEMLANSGLKMPTTVGGANATSTPTKNSSGIELRHNMNVPSPLVTQSSSDSSVSAKSTTLVNRSVSATESSQTDSDDVSPQVHRRRRHQLHAKEPLPKFSISLEEAEAYSVRALKDRTGATGPVSLPCLVSPNPRLSVEPEIPSPLIQGDRSRSGGLVKSSSTSGLSLIIPGDQGEASGGSSGGSSTGVGGGVSPNLSQSVQSPGGSSTASSRDASPCRDISPLINSLKPPIIIRRGPRGFGFTIRAIRVYFGDTDFYTVHHLVMEVDKGSPAFDAGLRPGDLVTHINGEAVQGLYHTQVLQLLMSGGEAVTLRATALETTSIKTGGRRRDPASIKMARRNVSKARHKKRDGRKASLFRKLSSKRASAEMHQMGILSGSRSLQSLREPIIPGSKSPPSAAARLHSPSPLSSPSESCDNSAPCSPAASHAASSSSLRQGGSHSSSSTRPSSLHGLKHKLHIKTKSLHSPSRRKSVGHIPLSPLARTPSPSPLPVSPTRSPSPLALPLGHHQPGSSNVTQTFSPGSNLNITPNKKSFSRPKSSEANSAGSPLLRRALSPDKLHPRSAEGKKPGSISPLCSKSILGTAKLNYNNSATNTSPLPSRALHSSPGSSQESSPAQEGGTVSATANLSHLGHHRKHSCKSLSQPTIPEEGPEHEDYSPTSSTSQPSTAQSLTNKLFATFTSKSLDKNTVLQSKDEKKSESKSGKNSSEVSCVSVKSGKESREREGSSKKGASGKDEAHQSVTGSVHPGASSSNSSGADAKSSSIENKVSGESKKSSGDSSGVKSPKLSRTESMTERTVQKITKVIRGSSRSESRSKKSQRDSSLSPKGGIVGAKSDHDLTKSNSCGNTSSGAKKNEQHGSKTDSGKKTTDKEKKSANEKREIFKSHHSKD